MTKRQELMNELADGNYHCLVGYFHDTAVRMARAGTLNFSIDDNGNFIWKIRQEGEPPTGAPLPWARYCALIGPKKVIVVKMPEQSVRWEKVVREAQNITRHFYYGEMILEFDGIDPTGCRNADLAFEGNHKRYEACDLFAWDHKKNVFFPIRIDGQYTRQLKSRRYR
jgi:hypothetical protein